MKTTLSQLLFVVRELIVETPDYVYENEPEAFGCCYLSGGDPKYPDRCGCLFGQALAKVGEPMHPVQEGMVISSLNYPPGVLLTFLQSVQDNQDSKYSWGDSWKQALETTSPADRKEIARYVKLTLPKR